MEFMGAMILYGVRRGVRKHGGRIMLGAHVEEVLIEGGRAVGVSLRGGGIVQASKAVVSNASLWDLQRLLPGHVITPKMQKEAQVNREYLRPKSKFHKALTDRSTCSPAQLSAGSCLKLQSTSPQEIHVSPGSLHRFLPKVCAA